MCEKYIDKIEHENERLRDTLKKISNLIPDKDSVEGNNEWGEAECFIKAKDLAIAALLVEHKGV